MACAADYHYERLPSLVKRAVVDIDSSRPDGSFLTSIAAHFVLQSEDRQGEAKACSKFRVGSRFYAEAKLYVDRLFPHHPLPIDPCDIDGFVRKFRRHDISITVYQRVDTLEYEYLSGSKCRESDASKLVFPLYVSENAGSATHNIKLLLVTHPKERLGAAKYMYIRSLEALYGLPASYVVCPLCLCKVSANSLGNHTISCSATRAEQGQTVVMPSEEVCKSALVSVDVRKKFMAPVIGFFDFECSTERDSGLSMNRKAREPMEECVAAGSRSASAKLKEEVADEGYRERLATGLAPGSYTEVVAVQRPLAYCMMFVTGESSIVELKSHSGEPEEVMKQFVEDLVACSRELTKQLNDMADVMPPMEPGEREDLITSATECWLCRGPFDAEDDELSPVIDHEHSSLCHRVLGVAHKSCNRKRTYQTEIPIYAHNLTGYDACLILKSLVKYGKPYANEFKLSVIPKNSERYITIRFGSVCFYDSVNHLAASLADIVESASDYDFPLFDSFNCGDIVGSRDKVELMRKGIFPFGMADSIETLRKSGFPPREAFYSELHDSCVSEEEYEFGRYMYEKSGSSNMEEYMNFYVYTDVMLLASVMIRYRMFMAANFDNYDVAQFMSAPHMCYTIALDMNRLTGEPLHLMDDREMVAMVESGIRGGISVAPVRHVELEEPYDPDSPGFILNLDANNLVSAYLYVYIRNSLFCLLYLSTGTACVKSFPPIRSASCLRRKFRRQTGTRLRATATTATSCRWT